MNIRSIIITINHDFLPKNVKDIIPKQAIILLNNWDTNLDGIRKFLYSFYSNSEWFKKEEVNKTIYYFSPTNKGGEWSAIICINNDSVELSGVFKNVPYVIL